jgi:hypothetical protein
MNVFASEASRLVFGASHGLATHLKHRQMRWIEMQFGGNLILMTLGGLKRCCRFVFYLFFWTYLFCMLGINVSVCKNKY